jgi:hypothetical protein
MISVGSAPPSRSHRRAGMSHFHAMTSSNTAPRPMRERVSKPPRRSTSPGLVDEFASPRAAVSRKVRVPDATVRQIRRRRGHVQGARRDRNERRTVKYGRATLDTSPDSPLRAEAEARWGTGRRDRTSYRAR